MFQPFVQVLERQLNQKINITISKDYDTHIERLRKGEVDFAYLGPASYVELQRRSSNHDLLARIEVNGQPSFVGHIVVAQNSPLTDLRELQDKRVAFSDPNSTMGHIVPRHMMLVAGVDVSDLAVSEFLDSHDDVALGVLFGDFDAGAVKHEVYEAYKPRGLKSLTSTPRISEHVFVASSTLAEKLTQDLQQVLYSLHDTPDGMQALKSIKKSISKIVPASPQDYEQLGTIFKDLRERGAIQ